jgi:hypothetical protein
MKNRIPFCLGIALAAAFSATAQASVVSNVDTKLRTFANDGDGMAYVLSGGVKKSIMYDETLKYPLDSKSQIRYVADGDKITSVFAPPGKNGLSYSRPLTDLEIAQINDAIIKMSQSVSATALALDPQADLGVVIDSFDALRGEAACKIMFYEKAVDVCGERFGRLGIVNWTMFNEQVCNSIGTWCIGKINYNIGYQSLSGRKAVAVTFLNRKTSDRFMQVFSSWSGSIPQRI